MAIKNAAYWLARFTTGCTMWYIVGMLVLGTVAPMVMLLAVWLKGAL